MGYKTLLTPLLALLVAALASPSPVQAQTPVSVEVRGGWSVPIADFSDAGAESGLGYGGDLFVHVVPALAIYGGWGRDDFSCSLCTDDQSISTQGVEAGLQFTAAGGAPVELWLRGGLVYHKVESDAGPVTVESDRKLGIQGVAGLNFAVGDRISLAPGVRFQTIDPKIDLDGDDLSIEGRTSFVSIQLGLKIGR